MNENSFESPWPPVTHDAILAAGWLRVRVSPLAIEGFALSMLAETLRRPVYHGRKPPRWLAQAREIIQAEFTSQLSLETIASRVGVHPMHLPRAFRQHYGRTVGELMRQLRLESARHQLSSCNLPIIEIALAAGFCDHSHFARSFKKLTGLSPTGYRAA